MKKVALVFVVAVLAPSLVLAWLAVRSLRDQQFLLERQQSLLCQRVTDSLAQNISDYLARQQQDFGAQVENLAAGQNARAMAARFDSELGRHWPLAEVGFCVTLTGKILSPSPTGRDEARTFYLDNSAFLGNREAVEVYNSANTMNLARNMANQPASADSLSGGLAESKQMRQTLVAAAAPAATDQESDRRSPTLRDTMGGASQRAGSETGAPTLEVPREQIAFGKRAGELQSAGQAQKLKDDSGHASSQAQGQSLSSNSKAAQTRKVVPQSAYSQDRVQTAAPAQEVNLSKAVPAEAEFGQIVGSGTDGMLARFLQNKLRLMFWHRLSTEPDLIFGAQLNLDRVADGVRDLVQGGTEMRDEICVAVLDDNARPVTLSRAGFQAAWKRPFVATEIGEALPHWEVAAYLVNPAQLTRAANTAKLTLGLLVAVLVLAIGVGSWLIVSSLNSELRLARQKTDFVGNVSHELKTPLTSIRMFSELLAEGRVADPARQHSYLNIITAEAARLTRLINNVLDFSRLERGEKKYNFQPCDLAEVVRAAAQTFRPHLETGGFKFDCVLPAAAVFVRGDADALSQIIVNLLSNAEKYSNDHKEITLELARRESPLPHAEVKVLDRGLGVPRGSGEKIFEKFYRVHDSLNSGVQGSGLGLTIARQIARAHGGDVAYEPREGGGSCFILRLLLAGDSVGGDVRSP
jgi:signal transduction histidine kinase